MNSGDVAVVHARVSELVAAGFNEAEVDRVIETSTVDGDDKIELRDFAADAFRERAAKAASSNGRLSVRRLADVDMRSIEWLDRPLFQRAAFHLVAGPKGAGKGTYLAGLAARCSRGELYDQPMNVLLVATEDSDEIDVKPRVVAAGGDVERIYSVASELLLPRDVGALRKTVVEIGDVGLVIVDPVASHVRGDTHAEDPVRNAIDPLNALANDLDCLLVGVRHLGKNTQGGALLSVLGSTAWVNVPRAVLVVAPDDEESLTFHIAVAAGNRSARGAGRAFRIELVDIGLKEFVTRALELGDSAKSVDDLLGRTVEQRRAAVKRDGAGDIILRELADGAQPLDYLKAKCAAEIGASSDTTWRAANGLKADGKITCGNSGPGTPWLWSLTFAYQDDFVPNSKADAKVTTPLTSAPDFRTLSSTEDSDFSTKSHTQPLSSDFDKTPQDNPEVTEASE